MTTPSQTVAGHPIAMKVGGRRLSVSKSPVPKSHLSTSPTATKDAAAPTPGDKPATDKADAKEGGDAYPRPNGAAGEEGAVKKDEAHKEEAKKDEQQQNKKDKAKQQFEDAKPQHHNKNPHSVKNVPIKQPGGQQH